MSRLTAFLRRLRADRDGVAAVEFALWATCFFVIMLGALDFGLWRTYQLRLSAAVEQGAMIAFNDRDALDDGTAKGIGTYIASAAHVPGAAVEVVAACNGNANAPCLPKADGANARTCACIATANGTTSYTPAQCGTACPGSATAGYYLTITARYPYNPIVLPREALPGGVMTDSATVRLQ